MPHIAGTPFCLSPRTSRLRGSEGRHDQDQRHRLWQRLVYGRQLSLRIPDALKAD
jgi:hypothetical protein